MPAAKYNIVVEQGANFSFTVTVKNSSGVEIDLTGYTLRGQIRVNQLAASALATFTGTILNQVSNKGQGTLSLTAIQTANIPSDVTGSIPAGTVKNSTYLYDAELVSPSASVTRILHGKVTLIPEITK